MTVGAQVAHSCAPRRAAAPHRRRPHALTVESTTRPMRLPTPKLLNRAQTSPHARTFRLRAHESHVRASASDGSANMILAPLDLGPAKLLAAARRRARNLAHGSDDFVRAAPHLVVGAVVRALGRQRVPDIRGASGGHVRAAAAHVHIRGPDALGVVAAAGARGFPMASFLQRAQTSALRRTDERRVPPARTRGAPVRGQGGGPAHVFRHAGAAEHGPQRGARPRRCAGLGRPAVVAARDAAELVAADGAGLREGGEMRHRRGQELVARGRKRSPELRSPRVSASGSVQRQRTGTQVGQGKDARTAAQSELQRSGRPPAQLLATLQQTTFSWSVMPLRNSARKGGQSQRFARGLGEMERTVAPRSRHPARWLAGPA